MAPDARPLDDLPSKREQQVMEVIYRRGRVSARELYEALPDAPSYNAVRGILTILEQKGRLAHETEGARYVYYPAVPRDRTARAELARLAKTFFGGSTAELVSALLDEGEPTEQELERMRAMIEGAASGRGGQ